MSQDDVELRDETATLAQLKGRMAAFVAEREWERFHQPKNLSMSIAIEAAELMEHFQWEEPELTPERRLAVGEELCDVLAYVLSLANALELDLSAAFVAKMAKNRRKYPPSASLPREAWASVAGRVEQAQQVERSEGADPAEGGGAR